jgi:hypothetical protein
MLTVRKETAKSAAVNEETQTHTCAKNPTQQQETKAHVQ